MDFPVQTIGIRSQNITGQIPKSPFTSRFPTSFRTKRSAEFPLVTARQRFASAHATIAFLWSRKKKKADRTSDARLPQFADPHGRQAADNSAECHAEPDIARTATEC
jgi:hypothetical protein